MGQAYAHEPENERRRVHDGGNQRSDREHPQSSHAGQTCKIYHSGDTFFGGNQHHIDRSQRPQSSNTGAQYRDAKRKEGTKPRRRHVQLSDAIRVFFDQKLSSHAEIYCGEQPYGNFASLPIVVKLVDENERNKREPRILSKLNHHSNVISLIETGLFHDGFESRIYIAIDQCHDENLQDFIINRSELSSDEKMIIVEQLIDGVRYIHDKNIVHLDLKPANILFSLDQKTIKIADFGLSEELSGKKMFLKYQFGTNGFRPPESFGNSYISLKTDIFSLGVVIFFVLSSGKNPFGEDFDALNVNVKNGKSDLSYLLVPNLHSIKHLIKCMIETERKNRPSIKQVSEHPCWTEKEAKCDFEYATSESSDSDPQSDSEEDDLESDLTTLTDLLARYSSKDEPSDTFSGYGAPLDLSSQTPLDLRSLQVCWGQPRRLQSQQHQHGHPYSLMPQHLPLPLFYPPVMLSKQEAQSYYSQQLPQRSLLTNQHQQVEGLQPIHNQETRMDEQQGMMTALLQPDPSTQPVPPDVHDRESNSEIHYISQGSSNQTQHRGHSTLVKDVESQATIPAETFTAGATPTRQRHLDLTLNKDDVQLKDQMSATQNLTLNLTVHCADHHNDSRSHVERTTIAQNLADNQSHLNIYQTNSTNRQEVRLKADEEKDASSRPDGDDSTGKLKD